MASDFSPAWHQGYFDARWVLFEASKRSATGVQLRSEAAVHRQAARALGYLEARPRDVLDYIDGAWHFLEAVMGRV